MCQVIAEFYALKLNTMPHADGIELELVGVLPDGNCEVIHGGGDLHAFDQFQFSLYAHQRTGGVEHLFDFSTRAAALRVAHDIARRTGLPITRNPFVDGS